MYAVPRPCLPTSGKDPAQFQQPPVETEQDPEGLCVPTPTPVYAKAFPHTLFHVCREKASAS